jgi:hypothetical protein
MTPQAEDSARLQELLGDMYAGRVPRPETQSAVLDVVLARVQCERVSMWKFDGAGAALTLLCFASKTAHGVFDTADRRLLRPEFVAYFNSLVDSGTYVSADAMNDPALQPMRASYVLPNKVVSMMDAAFVLNNRTYGMVCCEEPYPRVWRPTDIFSLRAIVNKLTLLMWNALDEVLLKTPSMPLRVMLAVPEPPPPPPPSRRR